MFLVGAARDNVLSGKGRCKALASSESALAADLAHALDFALMNSISCIPLPSHQSCQTRPAMHWRDRTPLYRGRFHPRT